MVTTTSPEQTTYRVIGTRPLRPDGVDKVTGRALYGADITLPGTLVGKVLRSPYAHARIRRIDTTTAADLPGVRAVMTAADLPEPTTGMADVGEASASFHDLTRNVMAREKVLYYGHAVAAVAAESAAIAEQALQLIQVEYEPLPPVLSLRAALQPDAPLLHEDLRTNELGQLSDRPSNIAAHARFVKGDPAAGFAEAEVVVERTYTTTMVHQGYIEPHATTAFWNADGQLTVWTTTQAPFAIRDNLATLLGVPVARIRVVPTEIGGGFGGKLSPYLEPLAAVLSRKSGAPVRMVMTRAEELQATGPTSGTEIQVKLGARRDGTIVAAEASLFYEAGAFPGSSVRFGALCMFAPYDIPHIRLDAYDVVVNKPKVAAYRAPGSPAAMFAGESAIDELAERLGMDPILLRLKNSARVGTRMANGIPFTQPVGNIKLLEALRDSEHYRSPLPAPTGTLRYGRGLAMGFWPNAPLKSSCFATVNPDGSVTLVEGNPDIGGTRASLAMQLAETLGIPYEKVKPQVADTDSVGYNDATGGSRTTFTGGIAVYELGQDLKRQLVERARLLWQLGPEAEIRYEQGVIIGPAEGQRLTFEELAAQLFKTGGPVVGRASVSPRHVGFAFSCHLVDLAVDCETGKVTILRYTAAQDVGRAVHPAYVEGQIQGGVAQGVGWALNEEYVYDEQGRLLNDTLLDYRMPTALDLPQIETILIEEPHPLHPFGVRGVGEAPIVPPLAAVANAISHALGVRFTDLPISPRRIVEALYP
ncbi:MAG: xanthine dehydrogenase family protein molybdopterin-binding subunit [Chloroflexi bacterium]|nr:xanthine dehydrogenase family protein molybdopterin-binding subunit [Chloroflexota bacterium]